MAEKKRKPLWLRLLIGLFSSVFSIIMLLGVLSFTLYVKYDINVFTTFSQLQAITREVNEEESFKFIFTDSDKASARDKINASFIPANLITYSESEGYGVNTSKITTMASSFSLTEKECGALLDILLSQNKTESGISIAGKTLSLNLVQISFEKIQENSVDFGAVVKIDLTSIKQDMTSFPLNWIAKYIPNNIYISSFVTITKGETEFSYTLASKGLSINCLDQKGTNEFLNTINKFISFGSAEELSMNTAGVFANGLIGNEETNGFAYSLKPAPILATDFVFETAGEINYFTIKK